MLEVVLNQLGFNYPLLLYAFHTACNWTGTMLFLKTTPTIEHTSVNRRQWFMVAFLSVVSSVNAVIGKTTVAVPTTFDQMTRSAVPFMVLEIVTRVFKRSVSRTRRSVVLPIVLGVAMTWYAKMEISGATLMVSLICSALSACKVVMWSELLASEQKISPLHLLSRLAPMTFIQVMVFATFRGETSEMIGQAKELANGWSLYSVAITGVASFIVTMFTLQATRFASPLTVAILGNLQQLLILLFSAYRLGRPLSRLNVMGAFLAVCGLVCYAMVSRTERRKRVTGTAESVDPKVHPKDDSASVLPTSAASVLRDRRRPSKSSSRGWRFLRRWFAIHGTGRRNR